MTQDGSIDAATAASLLGREFAAAVVNFHETAGRLMGLRASERKCMDTLERLGPVTAGTIAEQTGLTSGAVTGLVDRLEDAGYARRTRDPGDRRRVLIELVPNERLDAVRAAVFGPFAADMGSTMTGYDEVELHAILSWVRKATDVLIANTGRISQLERLD